MQGFDQRLAIWIGIIVLIVVFRMLRFVFGRARQQKADQNLTRLTAAAERVLAEQARKPARAKPARASKLPATVRSPKTAIVPSSSAVIRRGGGMFGGREPVIQRRR